MLYIYTMSKVIQSKQSPYLSSDEPMTREFFFHETSDYPYQNQEHKETMYKYVCHMIYNYGEDPPDLNQYFTDKKVFKHIEQRMEEIWEEEYNQTMQDQNEKDYVDNILS